MNIIYDFTTNNIRLIQYDKTQDYQIEDLFLYLPKNHKIAVYCRVIDSDSKENILKMNKVKQDKNYEIYQVALTNFISLKEGLSKVYFLIMKDEGFYSKCLGKLLLKYDNFTIASKMFLTEEFTKEMKTICKKIEEYTKLNIQLYKDMREVKGLDD